MPSGSPLAALALLLVVPLTLVAFTKWRAAGATALVMVLGLMYLPELSAFDLPVVPDLNKFRMVVLCCGVGQIIVAQREFAQARLMRGTEWILLCSVPLSQLATTLTNMDMPPGVHGAMSVRDLPNLLGTCILDATGPFLLGRMVFRTKLDADLLARVLVGCAVVYVPFALLEVFMGPTLHQWAYGFLPSSVEQARRGSVYRPMVFFGHGLALALFMYAATASSMILARTSKTSIFGLSPKLVSLGLLAFFPLLRSSAAIVYMIFTVLAVLFLSPKAQVKVAIGLSTALWLYMLLRVVDMLPVWPVIETIAAFSPERANSLGFRFANEDILMDRALLRPLFGWGGYGRNLVDGATCDGAWIIIFGSGGIVQLIISFGLLGSPIFLANRRLLRSPPETQIHLGGMSLIVAFCNLDLLPNGFFNYIQLFLAGSLMGLAWGMPDERKHSWILPLLSWYARRQRSRNARYAGG